MSEETPMRFDLIAALEGRTVPEEKVPIFLDEALMYEYTRLTRDSDYDPKNEEKARLREETLAKFKDLCVTVTVRGVPEHVVESIRVSVDKEYPPERSAFGVLTPHREADEEFTVRMWQAHVVQMETADGHVLTPGKDDILAFRAGAPRVAQIAVKMAIDKLTEDTIKGYEQIVQDPDFLSRLSPPE